RPLRGQTVERAVRVEFLVRLVRSVTQRLDRHEVAVRAEIGDVVHLRPDAPPDIQWLHAHVRRQLERTECATEANLLVIVTALVAHDQYRVLCHGIVHYLDQLRAGRLAQVRTEQLGPEQRMQWIDDECHGDSETSTDAALELFPVTTHFRRRYDRIDLRAER